MKTLFVLFIACFCLTTGASAQYGRGYAYPGRGYYSGGGHYNERYGQHYAPRQYAPRYYAPRSGYDWSWGGGNRGYIGGRGGGWGGEW